MRYLKQSTAVTITVGPLIDVTTGITPVTACTVGDITCGIIKGSTNAALALTAAAGNNDFVHIVSGHWSLELTAGNTDTLGHARVHLTDGDVILPFFEDFEILPANIYDSIVSGSDVLDVSLTQVLGTACTESTATAGVLDVNVAEISDGSTEADRLQAALGTGNYVAADVTLISGDGPAADNCELMFDGTGYAGGVTHLQTDVRLLGGEQAALNNLWAISDAAVPGGVDDPGATTTSFITNLTEATDDHYNGRTIVFVSGGVGGNALYGQQSVITDYTGATKTITCAELTEAPGNGDGFIIY